MQVNFVSRDLGKQQLQKRCTKERLGTTMSAKSLATVHVIYVIDERQNPLTCKTDEGEAMRFQIAKCYAS